MRRPVEEHREHHERRADEEQLPFALGQERPLERDREEREHRDREHIEPERDRGLLREPREDIRHERQPDRAGRQRRELTDRVEQPHDPMGSQSLTHAVSLPAVTALAMRYPGPNHSPKSQSRYQNFQKLSMNRLAAAR